MSIDDTETRSYIANEMAPGSTNSPSCNKISLTSIHDTSSMLLQNGHCIKIYRFAHIFLFGHETIYISDSLLRPKDKIQSTAEAANPIMYVYSLISKRYQEVENSQISFVEFKEQFLWRFH
jgi:hypothetical protein